MKRRHRSNSTRNNPAALPGQRTLAGGEHFAPSVKSARDSSRWAIAAAVGLIVLATSVAYSNSLHCALLFDDINNIVENNSIRHLWPIRDVFVIKDADRTFLHGRPVVNLSLAIDYAAGGLDTFHYHLTNLAVHLLAALGLFGIVRRTLLLPGLGERFAPAATPLALAVALVWSLHPLQTEAVTYVIQRCESMMGLFCFWTLYAAIRCGTSPHPRRWAVGAVLASFLAAGCKEVAVSIPLVVLLYDRAFLAGSFREAWRRRRWMYVGLAATWGIAAVLVMFSPHRAGAGYGVPVSWINYAASQFGVILHYLRLSFWPRPLVLDYGWPAARTLGDILPAAIVIAGLAAATAWALVRRPKWGFLGAWFFLILMPTSSIVPLADLVFEHRMYLPLAAVAVGVVIGGCVVGQWIINLGRTSQQALQVLGYSLLTLAGCALGVLTFQRNTDYRSELAMWEDNAAKAPGNERVRNNLGAALSKCGRVDDAVVQIEKALEIQPNYPEANRNFGMILIERGRIEEAIAHLKKALAASPNLPATHFTLARAYTRSGQIDEAMANYRKALELSPGDAEAHTNLGVLLAGRKQLSEAISHYRKALEINPQHVNAHFNLGNALVRSSRPDEAFAEYRNGLEIAPDHAQARNQFGLLLARAGRLDEAITQFQMVLKIKPDFTDARNNLAIAQSQREEMLKEPAAAGSTKP
jgi:protein O-mannosyl-transferase